MHCAASREGDQGEGVRVLVVPHVAGDDVGRIRRDDLVPRRGHAAADRRGLDERRLVGTRLLVAPPDYRG